MSHGRLGLHPATSPLQQVADLVEVAIAQCDQAHRYLFVNATYARRFGLRPEDVTIGMIAWAIGGVIGALPAGVVGSRIGRRNGMLLGFALMAACLLALNSVTTLAQAAPLLALASASWTFPTVNAYPLFVEPVPRERRGILAALFLLCMALGGAIGDPLNGGIFDLAGSYEPLFLLMAGYTALAFVAVLFIPRGSGEAGTGPESQPA